jgi:hypothetical protein
MSRSVLEQAQVATSFFAAQCICARMCSINLDLLMGVCILLWRASVRETESYNAAEVAASNNQWWEQYEYELHERWREHLRERSANVRRIVRLLIDKHHGALLPSVFALWHQEVKMMRPTFVTKSANVAGRVIVHQPTMQEQLAELTQQTAGLKMEVADFSQAQNKVRRCRQKIHCEQDRGDACLVVGQQSLEHLLCWNRVRIETFLQCCCVLRSLEPEGC